MTVEEYKHAIAVFGEGKVVNIWISGRVLKGKPRFHPEIETLIVVKPPAVLLHTEIVVAISAIDAIEPQ